MEVDEQTAEPSNVRVNIGIRGLPVLKGEIIREASALGQSTSEYGEAILCNRHAARAEIEQLKQVVSDRDKELEEMNTKYLVLNGQFREAQEKSKSDIASQIKAAESLSKPDDILKDERLLYLFKNLKGFVNKFLGPDGSEFSITYNSPKDVLIALIYATKLNPKK